MIPPGDVTNLQAAFRANPNDLGVGLYNPSTGEIRLGSFDLVTRGQGHQGLADAIGIKDNGDWRGFVVSAAGKLIAASHFNLVDGDLLMDGRYEAVVRRELQQAGVLF
jgi:hypothetical protein